MIHTSDHISFQAKWTLRYMTWISAKWKESPSLIFFRKTSKRAYSTAVVHFLPLSAHHSESSINQARVFYLVSWSSGNLQEVKCVHFKKDDSATEIGKLEVWIICTYKLLVPTGPVQIQSCVCYFLWITECCGCWSLWLSRSNNT